MWRNLGSKERVVKSVNRKWVKMKLISSFHQFCSSKGTKRRVRSGIINYFRGCLYLFPSADLSLVALIFLLPFRCSKLITFERICVLHQGHPSSRSSLICFPIFSCFTALSSILSCITQHVTSSHLSKRASKTMLLKNSPTTLTHLSFFYFHCSTLSWHFSSFNLFQKTCLIHHSMFII